MAPESAFSIDSLMNTTLVTGSSGIRQQCPCCGTAIAIPEAATFKCNGCGTEYAVDDGIPLMLGHSQDEPVSNFFEAVQQSVALGQVSFTPRAPRYMEVQWRIFASAARKAIHKWIPQNSIILDVGCGHGELIRPLTECYRICGIDSNLGFLRVAKAHGLRVYQSSATALPFVANQFDVVVCAEVIQHFSDPQPLLVEFARVCRPGGALIISTLNKHSLLRKLFHLLSQRTRLGSFDLPIIRRAAQEVCDQAHRCGWLLRDCCWVLSPTPFTIYGTPPAPIRERLATNYLLYFIKQQLTGGAEAEDHSAPAKTA